ncbi:MAG: alpha/beta hydrolase [Verrucomicrobiae bacterium]|nr:alpha/beta hydrolase [Verrucomicrobiae bacterium]
MKNKTQNQKRSSTAILAVKGCCRFVVKPFLLSLVTCHLLFSSGVSAAVPQWWITRGVIDTNLAADNYGPVNVGQLKHVAYQAALELEEKLPNGAGDCLDLVESFSKTNGNYAPVNAGQLKYVAKFFYDRLIAEGYTNSYPWTETKADDANFALINQGQLKFVFSFDLDKWKPKPPNWVDEDEDGLDDNWELENFGNLTPEPDDDMDGDGIPNSQEQQDGTDPNEPDEDPENPLPPMASYGLIHWQPVNHELGDSDSLYATWQVFVNDKGQAIATTAGQGVGVWTTAFAKGSVTAELEDYMCYNFNNNGKAILESPAEEGEEGDGFIYQVWDFESGDFTSAPPINSPPSLLPDDLEEVYSMDVIIDQIICEGNIEEKTSLLGINDPGSLAGTTVFQWRVKYHSYYYDQVSKQWKQSNGEKIINDFRPVYWPQSQMGNAMAVNEDFMETYSYLHTANINNQDAVALMKEGSQFLYYHHASEEPQTLDLPWDTRSRLNNDAQVAGSFYQGKSYATVSQANGPVQALGKGQAIGIAPQGELITGSLFSGQQQQTLLQEPINKTPALYQASLRQPTTQRERFPAKQRPALAKNLQNVPLTPQQNTIYEEALLWKKNQDNGKYVRQKVETMLEKTSLAQDWHVQTLHNPNKYGIMGGVGYYKDQPQYLTMIPVELGVDANRDGKIVLLNEKDKPDNVGEEVDQTKPDKYFRFWANEDDDTDNEDENSDSIPIVFKDSDDINIDSKRDLEDFSRLWVYLKGVHEMVKGEDAMLVGLKWKDTTGNPAIRLFEAYEQDGGTNYLSNDSVATQQRQGKYGTAVQNQNGEAVVSGSDIFIFYPEVWEQLDEENYKKYFLFEGVSEGKGKLQIVFLDKNQNEIGEAPPIYLEITNIKKMYERFKATPEDANFPPPFEIDTNPPFNDNSASFVSDPNGNPFQKPWDEKAHCTVFVHGWDLNYDESYNFAETLFKRMWQRGYKGHFVAFRWDTYTFSKTTFNRSEYRAWKYGKSLKDCVNSLKGQFANINLTAHSMGNIVASSALKQGLSGINNYVMMNPAISASAYDPSPYLNQPGWGNNTEDLYRGFLQGISANTKIFNYYLSEDFATATAWKANNALYKPNAGVNLNRSYQYNSDNEETTLTTLYNAKIRDVIDPHEKLSFVCASRTKALGAEGQAAGEIDETFDMDLAYGFDEIHSAQFYWNIQRKVKSKSVYDFYGTLLDNLGAPKP